MAQSGMNKVSFDSLLQTQTTTQNLLNVIRQLQLAVAEHATNVEGKKSNKKNSVWNVKISSL
jgi:hypothetical protein